MSIPDPTEKSGPLSGHVRKGRVYRSPLTASGVLEISDWTKDDLPDLLWPVLTLSTVGTDRASGFARWQKAVQTDLAEFNEQRFVAECLDGRLTSLDRLADRIPKAVGAVRLRADEEGLLPGPVVGALASYPSRPAAWLTENADFDPGESNLSRLAQAILDVLSDGHREAIIKCLSIWSLVQAGTFSTSAEVVELLRFYPNDPATRDRADGAVRSMWGAMRSMRLQEQPSALDAAFAWACEFWNTNSRMTECRRMRDLDISIADAEKESMQPEPGQGTRSPAMPMAIPEGGAAFREKAMRLFSSYVQALDTCPSDLYSPARQEVHSGLVGRVARDVIAALASPELWCMEHGSHVDRAMVETHIYLEWMSAQDEGIYQTFQEYGRGKAKLYALILEELPNGSRPPEFDQAIASLGKLSQNDDVFDTRVVDTRDSFAGGTSLRTMADECGLLDLYRTAYSISSGVTHSEWWSVESHAMERCVNILHRGHLVPSLSLTAAGSRLVARTWVDMLEALIRRSLRILETDPSAIEVAFGWIHGDPDVAETGTE